MERYSIINEKNPREIVLLRGSGCKWKHCTFCDYHLDYCKDEEQNFILNKEVLSKVTGVYKKLEVINSGSFCDLDKNTTDLIISICKEKQIATLHFEMHYMHRGEVNALKELFAQNGIDVKIKTGAETFDTEYREKVMKKGFGYATPEKISRYANEVCLLFGLDGQTVKSMQNDIETGLQFFDRVCINIMCDNSTPVKPNKEVISLFAENIAPQYINNDRVDILMDNLDFGIGDKVQEVFKK